MTLDVRTRPVSYSRTEVGVDRDRRPSRSQGSVPLRQLFVVKTGVSKVVIENSSHESHTGDRRRTGPWIPSKVSPHSSTRNKEK